MLWGSAPRRQPGFTPLSWLLGRASPVPGLRVSADTPEETPKACGPRRLRSSPRRPGHAPAAAGRSGGRCRRRGGGPKGGAAGGRPGPPAALPAGPPHPSGAAAVASAQEDPPGSGGCGPGQRGAGAQARGAGLIGWHPLPAARSPDGPPAGPRPLRLPARGGGQVAEA